MSDQWIFTKVDTELAGESKLESHHITVKVRLGVVTLAGMVPDADQKRLAVAVAGSVKGVKSVVDELKTP